MEIQRQGDAIFIFDAQAVQSNLDVQNHYAFMAARGREEGCLDEDHENEDVCKANPNCEWAPGRRDYECKNKDPCPRPQPKPRESVMIYDGMPMSVMLVYEAQEGGNILDPSILGYIDKFETQLLTDTDGAEMNGAPSRWDKDWCRLAYPAESDDLSKGKCAAVDTFLNLFSMTAGGRNSTASQVKDGYTRAGPLACMCTDADAICSVCTADGGVKGLSGNSLDSSQWPAGVLSCMTDAMTQSSSSGSQANTNNASAMCSSGGYTGMTMQSGAIVRLLESFCASKPSCQWAPPGGSDVCASTAFYRPTDGEGLVEGAEREAVLSKICDEENSNWWGLRKALLPQSFDCEASEKTAPFARTLFLAGGTGKEDDMATQFENNYIPGRTGWLAKEQQMERDIEQESGGSLRIMLFSPATTRAQFLNILLIDALLSIMSLIMVFLYMWWTLESAFLASCAMFEIFFSLPVSMSLWTVVFRQKIHFFQILTIYMILGIGADDAFILQDAWLQAPFSGDPDVASHWTHRFAWAYKRSFKAMAVTTATTCGSFLIGACSPLPQVRDFCIFAAIVVLVDWLFCETFFASAIVVHERYIKSTTKGKGECCGPGCCCGLWRMLVKCCCTSCCGDYPPLGSQPEKRRMEKICEGPLFNVLNKWRYVFIVFWALVIGGMLASAGVSLRTATKQPPLGKDSLDVIRGVEILRDEFNVFGVPTASLAWGLNADEPIQDWGTDSHDEDKARYDASAAARLTSPAGQMELLGVCRASDLGRDQGTRCDVTTCLVLGKGLAGRCVKDQTVWRTSGMYVPDDMLCENGRYCFMEEFARFWASHVAGGNCMQHETSLACASASGCAFDSQLNACYSTKTEDDYAGLPAAEFVGHLGSTAFTQYMQTRVDVLRSVGRDFEVLPYQSLTGYKLNVAKTELTFAWVSFNATYQRSNTAAEANAWYDRWDQFHDLHAPNIGGFHTTELYLFMVTQNEMVKAAIMGVCLSLVIAVAVMLLVTRNWRTTIVGMVNIVGISAVFLGVMPLIDWSLGESECIFLIAVVGLSVDYSVHLLHVYNHSPEADSVSRARHAISEMGISVVNSALTTLLASVPLFLCGFYFFLQFGAFIFFVIGFSILMSISFLIPLLIVCGPQAGQGDLCSRRAGKSAV